MMLSLLLSLVGCAESDLFVDTEATEAPGHAGRSSRVSDGEWRRQVASRVADAELAFGRDEGDFVAGIPSIDLRGRLAGTRAWLKVGDSGLQIEMAGVGRGDQVRQVRAGGWQQGRCTDRTAPSGDCIRRVEQQHDGLVQWWDSGSFGMEQGFDIARRPAGAGELRVDLDVGGVVERIDGDEAVIRSPGGGSLVARGLAAWDADGRDLPVRYVASGFTLSIRVDDAEARYPVTIDPTWSPQELRFEVEGDTKGFASAFNRRACDINADGYADVVAGAYGALDLGAVYIFLGTASGLPDEPDQIIEGEDDSDYLGFSVDCAGDEIGRAHV